MLHSYQFLHILFSTFQFRIGGPPIPGNYGHQIHLNHLVSASRGYQGTMFIKLIYLISYRRPADTRELWSSNSFKSFRIGGPSMPGNYCHQIHLHHLVSAAHRYQGTMVIKFIYIISYRRPADTNGIQRHRVRHLHCIGGLRVSISGSDLLRPVLSSSIGGSIPSIGGLSVHPLSHRSADTVLPANTTPPRCALELTQSICSDLPVFVFLECRLQTHIPEKGSLSVSTPTQ